MKDMTAVVLLSKTFFSKHPKSGELTHFAEKVVTYKKKHTIRSNYDFWNKKITKLKEVGGYLSIREWSEKPYSSTQNKIMEKLFEHVGIQKLELTRKGNEWSAKVDGSDTSISLLAENDGLEENDFKAWFAPLFDKEKTECLELAIIHFTSGKY